MARNPADHHVRHPRQFGDQALIDHRQAPKERVDIGAEKGENPAISKPVLIPPRPSKNSTAVGSLGSWRRG